MHKTLNLLLFLLGKSYLTFSVVLLVKNCDTIGNHADTAEMHMMLYEFFNDKRDKDKYKMPVPYKHNIKSYNT